MPYPRSVLITDFDGTITAVDFFRLAVERLLTPEDMKPWEEYRAGVITHFTAVRDIFRRISAPESEVLAMLKDMRPDPDLPEYVGALRNMGWHIVVASAGCRWYIDHILGDMGVELEVHASPGVYLEGGPLEMEPPLDSPFFNAEMGIDKAAVARLYLREGCRVIYAGDGFPDLAPALLLPPEHRYARADLADTLRKRSEFYHPFSVWSDIARALLAEGPVRPGGLL